MRSVLSLKPVLRQATLAMAIATALGGCGEFAVTQDAESDRATTTSAQALQVGVQLSSHGREKHNDGGNDLLNLQGQWHGWGDETSSIAFDDQTNSLRITAPTDASGISFGVRRFDGELTAGNWYSLVVDANEANAGALLFLIDKGGQVTAAVTDADGGLMLATDEKPLSFTAPENIVGFYLQVQSGYQATSDAGLVANVITQSEPNTTPPPNGELIAINQQWPHWDGSASSVSYDPDSGRLRIDAPDTAYALGARKLGVALQAETTYQLSALQNTDANASVLLFLFDAQHRVIPFTSAQGQTPWLAVSGDEAQTFVAPENVADVGIQVQSGYETRETGYLIPSLRVESGPEPDPSPEITPVLPPQQPVPGRPVPAVSQ